MSTKQELHAEYQGSGAGEREIALPLVSRPSIALPLSPRLRRAGRDPPPHRGGLVTISSPGLLSIVSIVSIASIASIVSMSSIASMSSINNHQNQSTHV